jgi:quercetin dioxygenase-like cupin family protein
MNMNAAVFTLIPSLAEGVEVPREGILSRPIHSDAQMRVTLFGMSAGQEMTEHTTTMEAILQFIAGEARITLGGESHTVAAGAWVRMAPNLPHSIHALTPLKMLLIVLRGSRPADPA